MLRIEIKKSMNFPKISLQEDLENIAKDIIVPDMEMRIDNGASITGGMLPRNDAKTIKRKGGRDTPLIDTGKLRRSFFFKQYGKSKVVITLDDDRKKIGSYLQSGIETKRGLKQYLFFGISNAASSSAMRYMRNRIKELTSGRNKSQ